MLEAIDRHRADQQAFESALGGSEGDMLDWLIGGDGHADPHAVAAPKPDERDVDQIALAVAVGALPLSELRRVLETRRAAGPAPAAPCDGGEDIACGSFLDRYLGAGVEPACEDALELFPEKAA